MSCSKLLPSIFSCVHDLRRALSNIGLKTDGGMIVRIRPGRLDRYTIVDVQSKIIMLFATREETQCTKAT